MTTDPQALAAQLAATIANLDTHIERRAQETAQPRIEAAEDQAQAAVASAENDAALAAQRWADLERELRRQLDVALRRAEHGSRPGTLYVGDFHPDTIRRYARLLDADGTEPNEFGSRMDWAARAVEDAAVRAQRMANPAGVR